VENIPFANLSDNMTTTIDQDWVRRVNRLAKKCDEARGRTVVDAMKLLVRSISDEEFKKCNGSALYSFQFDLMLRIV
jgi:hypothetical protein